MVWSASKLRYHQVEKTLIYHENSPRETEDCLFFMLSNHSFPDKSRLQMCLPEFSVVHSSAID